MDPGYKDIKGQRGEADIRCWQGAYGEFCEVMTTAQGLQRFGLDVTPVRSPKTGVYISSLSCQLLLLIFFGFQLQVYVNKCDYSAKMV